METVVAVHRYPVKSARGERLDEAPVEADGIRGDRSWACVDGSDGTVGSAKHPRRWGRLLGVDARWTDGSTVTVRVRDTEATAGSPEADALLTGHVGRPVRLTAVVPDRARLHRLLPDEPGMVPEWMAGLAAGQETVTELAGARPGGRFVDFGAVHLVTTGALARLAGRLGRDEVPVTRFRPNVVLDAGDDPEPGRLLRLGEVLLRVVAPTPRCVVPAVVDGPGPVDRPLLAALARHHRRAVTGLGRAACFGVYAEVVEPGTLRVGDPVTLR